LSHVAQIASISSYVSRYAEIKEGLTASYNVNITT